MKQHDAYATHETQTLNNHGAPVLSKIIRQRIQQGLALCGVTIARTAEPVQLSAVLKSLWPVESGYPLIRLGDQFDGGYLVPEDLDGIEACFSPGVGADWSFERACADRGMKIFMIDGAPVMAPRSDPRMSFQQMWLRSETNEGSTTLGQWVDDSVPQDSADLLLQMDIEGGEWEVLASADQELLNRFRVIVIELHQLHFLTHGSFFQMAAPVLKKLCTAHAVVHLHPNNCCGEIVFRRRRIPRVVEVTLLRRDRLRESRLRDCVDHPLDQRNTNHESLTIDSRWVW